MKRLLNHLSLNATAYVSGLLALFVLCFVPLLFHDAFFDINRIKVSAVQTIVPYFVLLMVFALAVQEKERFRFDFGRAEAASLIAMSAFLVVCVISSARQGFSEAVMLGNQGRYCGMMFFLCSGVTFLVIAVFARPGKALISAVMASACAIALLGIVNAMGVDPLHFYDRIQKGQETVFMSTIGHYDFFGTFVIVLLPLASAQFIFSRSHYVRGFALLASLILTLGAYASRTDSALIGVHLGCLALAMVSGGSWGTMRRACIVWAIGFIGLPVMRALLSHSAFDIYFSAPQKMLCDTHIAAAITLALLVVSVYLLVQEKQQRPEPSKRIVAVVCLIAFVSALVLLLGGIVIFTLVLDEVPLGKANNFLRFSDLWGTYRGFVFTRALRAFSDYDLPDMLLGKGLDTARAILTPYFDDPAMLATGVFNDAHNQVLQLLITGGILTCGAFLLLYVSLLIALFMRSSDDPLISGVFGSVFAYLVVLALNVTQPILILAFFSVSGLGIARCRVLRERGMVLRESQPAA